ncbi:Uncharacterised protein [Mycobacteroides abscessus subsp. massiliense]|nr:Uncharacterised protein [Mycobacteroides abscessus subsp. massiliense]
MADHRRHHQLGGTGLLFGPGVADDRQDGHHGGSGDHDGHEFVGHHDADIGFVDAKAWSTHDDSGWCLHHRDPRHAVGGGGVHGLEGQRCVGHQERQPAHPHANPESVAA